MARLTLQSVPYFDGERTRQIFNYSYAGMEVAKSTLKIYTRINNKLVLTSEDTENVRKGFHKLNHLLTNGYEYYAVLYVSYYDSNRNIVEESSQSNVISFKCISTPVLTCSNITANQIINKSSYTFEFNYNQQNSELLSSYIITLTDSTGQEIYNSEEISCTDTAIPTVIEHTIYNLPEGTFNISFLGETVNGLSFTQKFTIKVQYKTPVNYSVISAHNRPDTRQIELSTNYKIITGKIKNGANPIYIDEKKLDLSNNELIYEGLDVTNDFTVIFSCSNIVIGKNSLVLTNNDNFCVTVKPCYEVLYTEQKGLKNVKRFYFLLEVLNKNLQYTDKTKSTHSLKQVVMSNEIIPVNVTENNGQIIINDNMVISLFGRQGSYSIEVVDDDRLFNMTGNISFNGNQYIDIDYKPNNNTRIEVDFLRHTTSNQAFVFGCRTGTTDALGLACGAASSFPLFGTARTSVGNVVSVENKHTVSISQNGYYLDSILIKSYEAMTFETPINLYIGALNQNGTPDNRMFNGDVYGIRIYENNILIHNYIPVVFSGGISSGLLDIVDDQYFPQRTLLKTISLSKNTFNNSSISSNLIYKEGDEDVI